MADAGGRRERRKASRLAIDKGEKKMGTSKRRTMIGAGLATFTPVMWGLLQDMTPEPLRGRIFSIFNTGAMSASMLGMVAFGWATDRLGAQVSLVAMAVIFWLTAMISLLLRQFANVGVSKLQDA